MTEEQARQWMRSMAVDAPAASIEDADRVWMLAQIDGFFEPRRKLAVFQLWVDAALHSTAGLALAGLCVWAITLQAR